MANQTVYPYGTGGSLPSSIGIINDLTTGGADKALAAEQGKLIGEYLGDGVGGVINIELDLASYTTQDYSLGAASASSNRWVSGGKHKTIPVIPGEKYIIAVTSTDTTGGFYGFFSEQFVEPTSTSSDIPYATGETGRRWLNIGSTTFTIQEGTAYLVICPKDGSGNNSSWTVTRQTPKTIYDDFLSDDALDGMMEYALNLDDYDQVRAYPAVTNKWVCTDNNYPYYGIFIPCEPGQAFELIAKTNNDVVRYCFLRNNSYSQGASVDYATGYSGGPTVSPQGGASVTTPDNANYLYIVASFDARVTIILPSSVRTTAKTVEEIALTVASTIDVAGDSEGKIPTGLTKYEYSGPLVKVAEKQHYVAREIVATITAVSCQGGACYGDYLFLFTEENTTCWMYNLSTSELIQTITIPSGERGFVQNCHCNTVNFGTEKYDANDPFPLIYVSTGYASGGYSGALAYRIVATTESDATTYSLSLVQTIKFSATWSEFIVADDGSCYIKTTDYYRMAMPTLAQGDVTLDLNNALQVCKVTAQPSWYNGSRNQGHLYLNGKMCLVSGVPPSEASLFIVIDLATGRREVEIDIYNTLVLTSEPEAIFVWDGKLCIVFRNNQNVYAIYFE